MPTWLTPAAAKFWVGALGALLIAASTSLGDRAPSWFPLLVSCVSALGVYLTPNVDPNRPADDPYLPDTDEV